MNEATAFDCRFCSRSAHFGVPENACYHTTVYPASFIPLPFIFSALFRRQPCRFILSATSGLPEK